MHADYFRGPIPLTEVRMNEEIDAEYEANRKRQNEPWQIREK